MIFSLDYDGTITGDPEGFKAIVKLLRDRGHKVYIVTMRYPSECERDPSFMQWRGLVDGIIPTSRKAKKDIVELLNIPISIWIDDNPDAVYKSAEQIWGTPSPEGQVIIEDHTGDNISSNSLTIE